jgi:gamma-glutamylputrescine oxidase
MGEDAQHRGLGAPSYWQRIGGAGAHVAGPLPQRADCIVVGGGFAGIATALRLREAAPELDVVVLEAEHVGFGASGRNAGFLSPVAIPIWLLGADRDPERAWALGQWRRELDALAKWIDLTFPQAELQPSRLSIDSHSRLADAGLVEFSRALRCAAIDHDLTPRAPGVGRLSLGMAAFSVNPYRLSCSLAEHAVQQRVKIFEHSRVQRVRETSSGVELLVSGETICAQQLVLCTNAYTGVLDKRAQAWALPMYSYMLASATAPGVAPEGQFAVDLNTAETYYREHAKRILMGGFDRVAGGGISEHHVPSRVRRQLERALNERFPGATEVTDVWSGKLLVTPTGVPRIRKTTQHVVLNLGYGGTGVALTLALARFAAALVLERPLDGADARFFRALTSTTLPFWDLTRAVGRVLRSVLSHPSSK